MKTFKNILRWTKLIVRIMLALSGVGIGAIFIQKRERDYDNEIKTELVEGELDNDLSSTQTEKKHE